MDFYSRSVSFFKVLLPLVALGILATLFLLSRTDETDTKIPFAEAEMTPRMRDQQATKPFFSGTTTNGEEIFVSADVARPGNQTTPGTADNLSARIKLEDGNVISLKSAFGTVNPATDVVTFDGDVRISTSTGYLILTEKLNAALSGVEANTPGMVEGEGPIGEFTAGTMQITSKNGQNDVHMVFKKGVKLVYDPKQSER